MEKTNKKMSTVKAKKNIGKKVTIKKDVKKTTNLPDLKHFKDELIKIKTKIMSDIKTQLPDELTKDIGDEIDDVTQTIEKEMTFDLSSNQKTMLKDVDSALKKIENNTYGICELCKRPIEIKRLKAIPYTRYCMSCRQKQDR